MQEARPMSEADVFARPTDDSVILIFQPGVTTPPSAHKHVVFALRMVLDPECTASLVPDVSRERRGPGQWVPAYAGVYGHYIATFEALPLGRYPSPKSPGS